ncbi:hypothetical protein EG328_008687 [Venturia inaequalis]|uniref:Uncharacterized protein n=1 Tax=Venturia inaequalis TaxID=5025 RepID=A0A8H3VH44_VENIN|nr:hypothetical protein EG328_008687 [Venturia inaequalis]
MGNDSIASITQLTEYIHPLQALFEKCKEVFTPEEAGSIEKLVLDKMICPWWIILVREWDVLDDVVNRAKRHCEEWKKLLPQISKRCSGDDREETEKRCKKAWKSLNEAEEMLGDVTRLGHLLTM